MSASHICPLCSGSGFRSTDGGPAHQMCECFDSDPTADAVESTLIAVFKLLFQTLEVSEFSRVFKGNGMMHDDIFNRHLYAASEAVAKAYHGKRHK